MAARNQTAPIDDQHVARFREAMASFPSGVTIVTTTDRGGAWWGFTATSFCSLSADPPAVLVCLAKDAQCHPAFVDARSWLVHVIHPDHAELAIRFATHGADKFATGDFHANERGLPLLHRYCAALECTTRSLCDAGDHTILIGQADNTQLGWDLPAVYFRRSFHRLAHP
ncbi:MAG: flavin reductase [Pseudonocardiaceae bacterium]|nr:flavin reductase [Pseudonocardiaceae bacterium]